VAVMLSRCSIVKDSLMLAASCIGIKPSEEQTAHAPTAVLRNLRRSTRPYHPTRKTFFL
jgi:hypothetical protein